MKMTVAVLVEKEYNGKDILFPENIEIETTDVCVLNTNSKIISIGTGLMRLTQKSFKNLKKELIKSKIYERIMVI